MAAVTRVQRLNELRCCGQGMRRASDVRLTQAPMLQRVPRAARGRGGFEQVARLLGAVEAGYADRDAPAAAAKCDPEDQQIDSRADQRNQYRRFVVHDAEPAVTEGKYLAELVQLADAEQQPLAHVQRQHQRQRLQTLAP